MFEILLALTLGLCQTVIELIVSSITLINIYNSYNKRATKCYKSHLRKNTANNSIVDSKNKSSIQNVIGPEPYDHH